MAAKYDYAFHPPKYAAHIFFHTACNELWIYTLEFFPFMPKYIERYPSGARLNSFKADTWRLCLLFIFILFPEKRTLFHTFPSYTYIHKAKLLHPFPKSACNTSLTHCEISESSYEPVQCNVNEIFPSNPTHHHHHEILTNEQNAFLFLGSPSPPPLLHCRLLGGFPLFSLPKFPGRHRNVTPSSLYNTNNLEILSLRFVIINFVKQKARSFTHSQLRKSLI